MPKLKRRKIPGHLKFVTCHYCQHFYESKIRQTSGEFVTRQSKGKKIRVTGSTIWRFCPVVRSFTTINDTICNEENFEPTPLFYCDKTNCWLTPGITCYMRRARRYPMCSSCRQFDQVINNITETPPATALKRKKKEPYIPAKPFRPANIISQTDPETDNPKPRRIKRRRVDSSPETETISRKNSGLKRRRK